MRAIRGVVLVCLLGLWAGMFSQSAEAVPSPLPWRTHFLNAWQLANSPGELCQRYVSEYYGNTRTCAFEGIELAPEGGFFGSSNATQKAHFKINGGGPESMDVHLHCTWPEFGAFIPDGSGGCRCGKGSAFNGTSCIPESTCPPGQFGVDGGCQRNDKDPGNYGCQPECNYQGNPINPATGSKFERIPLYRGSGPYPLTVTLAYNSRQATGGVAMIAHAISGGFGQAWTADHLRLLRPPANEKPMMVRAQRPGGRIVDFHLKATNQSEEYESSRDTFPDLVTRLVSGTALVGWKFNDSVSEEVEYYNPSGQFLMSVNRQNLTLRVVYADGQGGARYAPGSPTAGDPRPAGYSDVPLTCTPPQAGWHLTTGGNPPLGRVLCLLDHFGRQVNFRHDPDGRVVAVADPAGHIITLEYDGPSAERWNPSDPAPNLLTKVIGADWAERVLHYNEREHVNAGASCPALPAAGLPQHLTGVSDSASDRTSTWTYDCEGRATASISGGSLNANVSTLVHDLPTTGQVTLTEQTAAGAVTRVLNFNSTQGVLRPSGSFDSAGQAAPCLGCGVSRATTYDDHANPTSRIDWNNNKTCYFYDSPSRKLETRRVEGLSATESCTGYASGSPSLPASARMVSTEWHDTWRLPTRIAEPLRITTINYGPPNASNPGERGNILSRTVQATSDATGAAGFNASPVGLPRTWTYTWNANGRMLTDDGPRDDVADITTYTYHSDTDPEPGRRGQVASITNASGHVTSFTAYNAHGQPTSVIDANGTPITLTYDARLRIQGWTYGDATTAIAYTPNGQVESISSSTEGDRNFEYDAAGRLKKVIASDGASIEFDLDVRGNRIAERMKTGWDVEIESRSREFDALSRLKKEFDSANQVTTHAYDNNGNPTSTTTPLQHVTMREFDALNRLKKLLDPVNGADAPTEFAWNGQDRVTSVKDPLGVTTTYTVNGHGETATEASPDGGPRTRQFDLAGNLASETDGRGVVAAHAHDGLNRRTGSSYAGGGFAGQTVSYGYDAYASNNAGRGRLTSVADPSGTTVFRYDANGQVLSKTQTVNGPAGPKTFTIGYQYSGSLLSRITFPSGRVADIEYDSEKRPWKVRIDNAADVKLDLGYRPFGRKVDWRTFINRQSEYGDGYTFYINYDFDHNGRLAFSWTEIATSDVGIALDVYAYDHDADGRLTRIEELDYGPPIPRFSGTYDGLDRLRSFQGNSSTRAWNLDANGNRVSESIGGNNHPYTRVAGTNRLYQVGNPATRTYTYDGAGNITADGQRTYTYDARGFLASVTVGGGQVSYATNAFAQRVMKA
ncbi:MAG: DUF6531 domain-containing protein, partial [Burkholderiales bacterium]